MGLPSSPRYGDEIDLVALHSAEGARTVGSLYGFFDRNQNASSHAGADGYQLAEGWVPDERAAWTLLNGNSRSLNLEQCGFARWTRQQWLSEGWVDGVWNPRQMIRHAALWTRQKCDRHNVPKKLLTPEEVGRGERGIIDHARYTFGTGDGDHTDVGRNYPFDVFMADVFDIPLAAPGLPGEDTMYLQILTGPDTGAMLMQSGGLITGLDGDSAKWAVETSAKANNSLISGITGEVAADVIRKSNEQQAVPVLLRQANTKLDKLTTSLDKLVTLLTPKP